MADQLQTRGQATLIKADNTMKDVNMRFGQFFAAITGRQVAKRDDLSTIESAAEQALGTKLNLVRSSSNLVAARGNVFSYSTGAMKDLDARIDALLHTH